jgi:hypothetical protein
MKKLVNDIDKLLNEQTSINGYYAVVLSEDSYNQVKDYANYKIIRSNHVTIAFNPTVEVAEKLSIVLGKRISIKTKELCENNNIQAFTVEMNNLERMDEGIAHITVSHTENAKPYDSNEMLKNPDRIRNIELNLNGTFKYIPHNK